MVDRIPILAENPFPVEFGSDPEPVKKPTRKSGGSGVSVVGVGESVQRFTIDDIIHHGQTFFSDKKEDGTFVGLPIALQEALDYATPEGIVVTMPELIAAKIKADKKHDFWTNWHTVYTEENIGIDKKGLFYKKGEPIVVIVNGGGILTPARIRQAYAGGLIDHSAQYTNTEFDPLLEGHLPDGSNIKLYKLEDVQKGLGVLPHRFGVVLPYKTASKTISGFQKNIPTNPLALARAASLENLEAYYTLAKDSKDQLGNWHVYGRDRDPQQPQGRVLYLGGIDCNGLYGNFNLDNYGRVLGVAPEAHRAKK